MSVLDTENLVSVLLHHRILRPEELAGGVSVRAEVRRNNSWHLQTVTDDPTHGSGRALVIKQMRVNGRDDIRGLLAEIDGLSNPALLKQDRVPELLGWDEVGGWFVTADCRGPTLSDILLARHLPDPETLNTGFDPVLFALSDPDLGVQVRDAVASIEQCGLETTAPLPYGVRFALGQTPRASRAYEELGRICDSLGLASRAANWRVDASIHGDLRPDNIRFGRAGLRVLDWELSGRGALGWDTAMLVSHLMADRGVWRGQIDETSISPASLFTWLRHCRPFLAALLRVSDARSRERVDRALHWLPLTLFQAAIEFQKQETLSVSGLLLSQLAETLVQTSDPLSVLLGSLGEAA